MKKIKTNSNIYIYSLLISLITIGSSIAISSCTKHKDDEMISWISYKNEDGVNEKVSMPYCQENVETLCISNENLLDEPWDFVIVDGKGGETTIPQSEITGIHFGEDWDEMTEAPNYFCCNLFNHCEEESIDVNLPKNITCVHGWFCAGIFSEMHNIVALPNFEWPNITEISDEDIVTGAGGQGTCLYALAFAKMTKLESIPASFFLPDTDDVTYPYHAGWYNFAQMFYQDESLKVDEDTTNPLEIPEMPTDIDCRGWAYHMFQGCTILLDNGFPENPTDLPYSANILRNN